MFWNEASRFWPDGNGLEWRKSILADWNSLDWRKSVWPGRKFWEILGERVRGGGTHFWTGVRYIFVLFELFLGF
jgi:hypothetical protein